MRPLSLTIQAFGPFVDRQTIDFTGLRAGLFLISGPTGAGKTSIFDALSYALFGEASGTWRQQRNLRSDYAAPSLPTLVNLLFTQQGQTYQIERSPAYERAKKSGQGTTKQQAQQMLRLPDGRVLSRRDEIDEKIQEILGIGVEQFRQTTMLAQGEFTNFLKAGSDERSQILRKIFATQKLQSFQGQLKERLSQAKQVLDNYRTQARIYLEGMQLVSADLQAAWEEFNQQTSSRVFDLGQPLAWLDLEISRDGSKIKKLGQEVKRLSQRQKAVTEEVVKAREIIGKVQNWQKLKAKLDQAEKQAEGLEERIQQVRQRLDLLAQLGPHLASYEQIQARLQKISQEQENLQENFEQVYLARKAQLERERLAFQDQLPARQKQADQMNLIRSSLGQYKKMAEEELEFKSACQALQEQEGLLVKAKDQEATANQAWQAWQAEEAQRLADLAYQARLLAETLEEGQACPVCGSTHHPQPAQGYLTDQSFTKSEDHDKTSKTELADQARLATDQRLAVEEQWVQLNQQKDLLVEKLKTRREGLTYASLAEAEQALAQAEQEQLSWARQQEKLAKKAQQLQEEEEGYKVGKSSLAGQLQEAQAQRQEQEEQMLQVLQAFALDSLAAFRKLGLEEEALRAEDKSLAEAQEQLKSLRLELAVLEKNWQAPETLPNLSQLEQEETSLEQAVDQTRSDQVQSQQRLVQHQQLRDRLLSLQEAMSHEESRTRDLQELSDAANGSLQGGLKRDFETYVQGYYFQWILEVANQRLAAMTNQRYCLKHAEESADRRSRTGLEMAVLDNYSGQTRELSTLSGGESFQTAMALALALSDVARSSQGGLALETLFIDEGFGSLDRDSLHKAVTSLLDLASGSYLCGLISHVEELKEIIPRRLEVEKTDQGSHIINHLHL